MGCKEFVVKATSLHKSMKSLLLMLVADSEFVYSEAQLNRCNCTVVITKIEFHDYILLLGRSKSICTYTRDHHFILHVIINC